MPAVKSTPAHHDDMPYNTLYKYYCCLGWAGAAVPVNLPFMGQLALLQVAGLFTPPHCSHRPRLRRCAFATHTSTWLALVTDRSMIPWRGSSRH